MKRYKSIIKENKVQLKEGMRYNTDYFEAGKDLRSSADIDKVIGTLKEFIKELESWKKQGVGEVQGNKGEFIPMWK